jgi:cytochrome c-type biogenesis protein CcmH/NrfG
MVRAQVALEERDIATAAAEFAQCTDLLGVAHYGDFLLRSNDPAVAQQGEKIIRRAAKKDCPFAHFAIGRLEIRRENFKEAAAAFAAAADLGYPDAAWLAGCAWVELRKKGEAEKWFTKARDEFADERARELLRK